MEDNVNIWFAANLLQGITPSAVSFLHYQRLIPGNHGHYEIAQPFLQILFCW